MIFFLVSRYGALRTHPRPLISVTIHQFITKTHPPPKHDVITERPFNGFSINFQGKKQVENKHNDKK